MVTFPPGYSFINSRGFFLSCSSWWASSWLLDFFIDRKLHSLKRNLGVSGQTKIPRNQNIDINLSKVCLFFVFGYFYGECSVCGQAFLRSKLLKGPARKETNSLGQPCCCKVMDKPLNLGRMRCPACRCQKWSNVFFWRLFCRASRPCP